MTTKTLFLFTESPIENENSIFFFEKEGDYSHLDGTYINATTNELHNNELMNIVYNWGPNGPERNDPNIDEKGYSRFIKRLTEPTKDWTFFVKVGFFL